MKQTAPDPTILHSLVDACAYRPGWSVYLQDIERDQDHGRGTAGGLTLVIVTLGYNSYHPDEGEHYRVNHYFIVPAATFGERAWRRWLLDCFLKVEQHEACEFFIIDGDHPFPPHHGPGEDPYVIYEHGDHIDARTSFRGTVNDA